MPDRDLFKSLSSFLKAYLHIYDLDKPFTGGIGSFKLYIMIASVIENCRQVKKQLNLGDLLSEFFLVFRKQKNLNKNTVLRNRGLEVDFAGNFQAALCSLVFDQSYKTIEKGLEFSSGCSGSLLSKIIHCKTLQRFRDKSLDLCNSFPMYSSEEKDAIGEGFFTF